METSTIIIGRCMYTLDIPRISRIAAIGFPYHTTQRRNHWEHLFEDKNDFR